MFCSVCKTVSCFICGATGIDYNHFDHTSRGGKLGQCPLWDQPAINVDAVEKAALEKLGSTVQGWDRKRLTGAVRAEIEKHQVNEKRPGNAI